MWVEIVSAIEKHDCTGVTPLAGVWVEIVDWEQPILNAGESLPLRECGLKYLLAQAAYRWDGVTPLAGVWVEIWAIV